MKTWDRFYVAPLTPTRPDGRLHLDAIEPFAATLIRRGAEGIYLCGGTGEGVMLTIEERMAVVDRWSKVVGRTVPMIVHVGHNCLTDARALACHAAEAGAVAISSMGPMFPAAAVRDVDVMVRWSASIAEAAPHLPFLHYHFGPVPGGARLSMTEYLTRAIDRIPNFGGLKYTHDDLMEFSNCLRIADNAFGVLYGKDEMMLPALTCGARGFAGGTYNLTMPLAVEIHRAYRAGDLDAARRTQEQLHRVIAVFQRYGGLPALKAAMVMIGLDLGPARQPWTTPDAPQIAKMTREIERVWPQIAEAAPPVARDAVTLVPPPRARSKSVASEAR